MDIHSSYVLNYYASATINELDGLFLEKISLLMMNLFVVIILFASVFYQPSVAPPNQQKSLRYQGGLQISFDRVGPADWYFVDISSFSLQAGAIACRDIYDDNSIFTYYTTEITPTVESEGRMKIDCSHDAYSIQDCNVQPIPKSEYGQSVKLVCILNNEIGSLGRVSSDNTTYMLQGIGENTELYYWGKVCLNNEITRATACTNLENDGIYTFISNPSPNRISFTNFSCEMNEVKLIDCVFELSYSQNCTFNEQLPFDCDAPLPPTGEPNGVRVISIATTTPMLRPSGNTTLASDTTSLTPNTTTLALNTTSSPKTTTITSDTIPTLQSQPLSIGFLAGIATLVASCIILTLIITVLSIVGIILTKRLKSSKIRERNNDYQVGTNLDYEVIEPELAQQHLPDTVHMSISLSSQPRYQELIPDEMISELEAIYSIRTLEPPEDIIYEQIVHEKDAIVPTVEVRGYLNVEMEKGSGEENAYLDFNCQLPCFTGQNDGTVWEPEETVEGIYAQMSIKRYREIKAAELKINEMLGEGNFGNVHSGVWRSHGGDIPVAIKSLKVEDKESCVSFLQEAAILGQFNHPNILKLIGVVTLTTPLMMVTELMRTGLKEFLLVVSNSTTIPKNQLGDLFLRFTLEIASGMEHLVFKKHVHRDLAARNILVSHNLTCKIGDFGLARGASVNNEYYLSQGGLIPVKWTAPEAIIYKKYSEKSDVFSFGITLYEIWSVGEVPWNGIDNEIVSDIKS